MTLYSPGYLSLKAAPATRSQLPRPRRIPCMSAERLPETGQLRGVCAHTAPRTWASSPGLQPPSHAGHNLVRAGSGPETPGLTAHRGFSLTVSPPWPASTPLLPSAVQTGWLAACRRRAASTKGGPPLATNAVHPVPHLRQGQRGAGHHEAKGTRGHRVQQEGAATLYTPGVPGAGPLRPLVRAPVPGPLPCLQSKALSLCVADATRDRL